MVETSVVKSRPSVPHGANLFKYSPNLIFGIDKARHFKLCVLIDAQEYYYMHNILSPKGMCPESRDLFKFWEMCDNISLTVQDRDIVAMED